MKPKPRLQTQGSKDSDSGFLAELFACTDSVPAPAQVQVAPRAVPAPTAAQLMAAQGSFVVPPPSHRRATSCWTKAEDVLLENGVRNCGEHNWKQVATEFVPSRNPTQCRQRWQKVIKPGIKKGAWEKEEDELLTGVVLVALAAVGQDINKIKWKEIAEQCPGRTHKKCRERWKGHLDPSINHSEFSPQEDALLMQMHARVGNKYADIARCLQGRTADKVKSRLRTLTNRAKKGILDPLARYAQQAHDSGALHTTQHISAHAAYNTAQAQAAQIARSGLSAQQAQAQAQTAQAAHEAAENRAGQLNTALYGVSHSAIDDGSVQLDTMTAEALDCLTECMGMETGMESGMPNDTMPLSSPTMMPDDMSTDMPNDMLDLEVPVDGQSVYMRASSPMSSPMSVSPMQQITPSTFMI